MKPSNTETQEIEQHLSAEQGADLAALQAAANEATATAPGAPAPEPQHQGPTLGDEIAGLLKVAVATLGPMFPSLKTIYTPETIGAASGAIAGVCEKRGWLQGGLMGEWAEEITAVAIVGPLAFATYQGVTADMAARAKPEPAKLEGLDLTAQTAAPMPTVEPQKTVTFGAAAPAAE
jgi:hypothetical protein